MPSPDRVPGEPVPRALRLVHTLLSRRWGVPGHIRPVRVLRGVDVPMRDGVRLQADVYLPGTAGPHPTVLLRSPYRRGGAFPALFAVPYAARGYATVLQSVRGTFGSGGDFVPAVHEADDGQDTVAWLRGQPWFDGRLATLGPSYLAFTQWALALDPPPELRAMVVQLSPHDLAAAGVEGAFHLQNVAIWAELMSTTERFGPSRGTLRLLTSERRLAPRLDRLPLRELPDRLGGKPTPWFGEWLQRPDLSDPYWERYRTPAAVHATTVPTLLVGGWHDWFLEQTLHQYAALRDRDVDVRLTVGPWAHLTVDPRVATAESLAWLAGHLPVQGQPPPDRTDRVRVFVTGADEWRDLPDWPPASLGERTWWLHPGALLADGPPGGDGGTTSFTFDPVHPTPSVGGRVLTFRAGARDNRRLEARDDVRTFTTGPLAAPVELLGGARVRLCVTSDNPYGDLFVRLCDVDGRGRSVNVTDRLVRLDPADGHPPPAGERAVEVTLPDTAHRFAPGHRIRLQVSGGAHPRYARNLGTGEKLAAATRGVPVTHRIGHSAAAPSSVTLPTG